MADIDAANVVLAQLRQSINELPTAIYPSATNSSAAFARSIR